MPDPAAIVSVSFPESATTVVWPATAILANVLEIVPELVIVTVSLLVLVVIVIPVPAANVNRSFTDSATTSTCPATEIVLKDVVVDAVVAVVCVVLSANTILETDAILNSNSTTSNIDSIEWELYSGSIVNINIEPADVFVFGTNYNDINETISNTHIVHNKWSDIRLKENIKLVGQSKTGINVYQFSYIGESDLYEGVIAQELLGTEYESAAILSENDLYKVDYSQLDVEFKKIK
jgi:hypothetical protein